MAATAAVYNRLHNSSLGGTGGAGIGGGGGPGGLGHSQLARSLERILEEAHLSGELILTNRKLKDFPKTGTKYNLTDTVIADLSRNRFCELPEEITSFSFLETLLLYHNTIRSIPESVKQLTSLTYLDLRSNQLSSLPREICFLPLQVLLVSNNRLAALPDELGRMDRLTDLDASYNQLAALPARIGELRSLRSFSLRSNQLMYLPRELTCLTLVSLDISNNRIASLPLEIRQMVTLVEFNLENNPLTSPPASLCVRGLVHVFKFLETQATKDEKSSRAGGNYDGYTTLRRAPRHNSSGNVLDATQTTVSARHVPRHHVDSGYSTCDGIDKRWSHDMPVVKSIKSLSESPIRRTPTATPTHSLSAELMDASLTSSTSTIVDESITLSAGACESPLQAAASPIKRLDDVPATTLHQHINYAHSNSSSNGSSPEQEDIMLDHQQQNGGSKVADEKLNKSLNNIQTYKEYKEALKQQRNHEISSVYKIKGQQKTLYDMSEATHALNANNCTNEDSEEMRFNGSINTGGATLPKSIMKQTTTNGHNIAANGNGIMNGLNDDCLVIPKKPIQKVIPSRNTELMSSQATKMHSVDATSESAITKPTTNGGCLGYVKPNSPLKTANGNANGAIVSGILSNNNKFNTAAGSGGIKSPVGSNNKFGTVKTHRTVTWNHDIPSEKLSFTMRREFDRQREETELMSELRTIIETRLKMTLPEDIASALTDGVILCHLANYVRPRSVASIHVPSPGVSKLTMARCRRNVDNFLEACRRIGVDEELICSCEDVVPQIDDDNQVVLEDKAPNNNNNNYDDHNQQVEQQQQLELKETRTRLLPNPAAVLQTVLALIAMDFNPNHQNIHYAQQQQELQRKLQKHLQIKLQQQQQEQQQAHNNKSYDYQRQHCLNANENESFGDDQQQQQQHLEHEQLTAPTCTTNNKQQMLQQTTKKQQQQQNYEIVTKMEFENSGNNFHTKTYFENIITTRRTNNKSHNNDANVGNDNSGDHEDDGNGVDDRDNVKIVDAAAYVVDADTNTILRQPKSGVNSVTQLLRTAKLKTFQKIKLNLLTSHGNIGNSNNNNNNNCTETTTTTLQTIVESDSDVNNASSNGHYQLINEKPTNEELPLNVHIATTTTTTTTTSTKQSNSSANKYKLMNITAPIGNNNEQQEQQKPNGSVSKCIEFFEHSANAPIIITPATAAVVAAAVKPKVKPPNIFSIYRVNDLPNDKVTTAPQKLCCVSPQEKNEAGSSLLKHDSHTLTIILSCVFIVTFLLLIFFPLPG